MKKWMKFLTSGVLVTSAVTTLSACSNVKSASTGKYENSLTWMTTSEVQTLDQNKIVDVASGEQAANVFEGLNTMDKNGKVVPGVAALSTSSKDGLTWTFKLRKNAKWSNGAPVTAKDFVYSLQRMMDPKTQSQQQNNYQAVKNAKQVVAGQKSPTSLGVEAKDSHTLIVHLVHPVPYFRNLTATSWNPVNKAAVKKYGKKYGTASKYMVYNGPFVSTGWTGSNLTWKLKKNNQYWDKKDVKLKTVNYTVVKTPSTDYNLYQAGKLDGAFLDTQASKQLKNQNGYRVFKLDRTEYLTYNVSKNKDMANVNVRRAFSMALDRSELAKLAGGANTVAATFTGPQETVNKLNFNKYFDEQGATSKYTKFNKLEAKAIFEKGLKELGKTKMEFTLGGDDDDVSKKILEYVQSQLESTFGKKVDAHVRIMPKTTRVSKMLNGNYDVDYTGLNPAFTDPYAMLSVMATGENYNFGKWSNKQYDNYLDASSKEMDVNKRLKNLVNAEKVLDSEQPLSPLFHDGQAWMVRSSVHDLEFTLGKFKFKNTYVVK